MKTRDEHLLETHHKGIDKREYKRLSGRTVDEFTVDIKQAHKDEKEIVNRYVKFYKSKTGVELTIIDNGVDNSGEFIPVEKVNDKVDFIVGGKPMEIKTIKNDLNKFRLKLDLLKSYLRQDGEVMVVMGWKTKTPQFTVLGKEELNHMIKFGKKEISGDWEGKKSVYVYKNSLNWNYLPH